MEAMTGLEPARLQLEGLGTLTSSSTSPWSVPPGSNWNHARVTAALFAD
jgi:hypothetical protein